MLINKRIDISPGDHHQINLRIPHGEPEYKFDFTKVPIGWVAGSKKKRKLVEQELPPTPPEAA